MTQPTIAIVGAGLSGLVLARILQINGIDATVYEADATGDVRSQGGSLDIHDDSGQFALRVAGLYERFREHVQPQGEHVRVLDRHGKAHIDAGPPGGEGGRPEIDRTTLRRLLLDSLTPGRVVWNHKVISTKRLTNGGTELTFADGGTAIADLLIGADGTWSRVRPLLSDATPAYCGITHIEIHIPDPAAHPDQATTVGPGVLFALGGDRAIMGHGGTHIDLGAALRVPPDWLAGSGVDWSDPAAARAALLVEYPDWAPALTALVDIGDSFTPRQIFALPVGHRWDRVPGVTLIGDAAHVMSPYAGEGANLAMLDGATLAQALLDHPGDAETALHAYETEMFPRAARSAQASDQGLEMCFGPQAPHEIVNFFSEARR
ncbi:FAD-dependent oxidoreductase [Dactylosporangium sp. CA-233914]|uniref:FAD-dependent oxidoreductase n=1 Tax=Dactylosporangium sp. CA-233914 TaxID=3239934 RepID=UPI003D91008F